MDASLEALGSVHVQNAMASRFQARSFSAKSPEQAEAAAKEFEAMFMAQMLAPMWEGVETDGIFGGGHGEEMMRGFLLQEYGKAMAQGGGFGLADSVKSEILRLQETQQQGNAS